MASTGATGFEVITTGATGAVPIGLINNGCVLVMLIAGAVVGVGRGKTLMRAVSFFGPRFTEAAIALSARTGGTGRIVAPGSALVSAPGGFGKGCKRGEEAGEAGGVTGGRRGRMVGVSVVDSEEGSGVIVGGNRRIGVTGVRDGRTMRAVSRFTMFGAEAACSGRGGSAMRTVSFFGSAMSNQRCNYKFAQTGAGCHLLIWSTGVSPVRPTGVPPVFFPIQGQARRPCSYAKRS